MELKVGQTILDLAHIGGGVMAMATAMDIPMIHGQGECFQVRMPVAMTCETASDPLAFEHTVLIWSCSLYSKYHARQEMSRVSMLSQVQVILTPSASKLSS